VAINNSSRRANLIAMRFLWYEGGLPGIRFHGSAGPRGYFTREYVETGVVDQSEIAEVCIAWLPDILKIRLYVHAAI
jgi:hypothetical protein